MRTSRLISGLLLVSAVAGCSSKSAPVAATAAPAAAFLAVAPAASKEDLMKAVFGKLYRPATKDALAQMPMFEDRKKMRLFDLTPLAASVLASGQTVLVAQAEYAQENAEKIDQPDVIDAYYAVYFLRQTAGQWTVVKRHENMAYRGLGGPGTVLFLMLGKDKPGLAIVSTTSDEGCSSHMVHLFDLHDDPLRDLTDSGISSYSSWNKGCGGSAREPENETKATWFLAEAKKPSAYNDVVMKFTSTTRVMSGQENETESIVTKKYHVRYAYDGKHYQLASGENPSNDGPGVVVPGAVDQPD